eukprot:GHVT01087687.1.p1 GENE.GHVT01087687.1~~GHVT01087687.1.p1  ORF type:complete len:769 (-),score=57.46 GHVT01087687.1:2012-4318(-)
MKMQATSGHWLPRNAGLVYNFASRSVAALTLLCVCLCIARTRAEEAYPKAPPTTTPIEAESNHIGTTPSMVKLPAEDLEPHSEHDTPQNCSPGSTTMSDSAFASNKGSNADTIDELVKSEATGEPNVTADVRGTTDAATPKKLSPNAVDNDSFESGSSFQLNENADCDVNKSSTDDFSGSVSPSLSMTSVDESSQSRDGVGDKSLAPSTMVEQNMSKTPENTPGVFHSPIVSGSQSKSVKKLLMRKKTSSADKRRRKKKWNTLRVAKYLSLASSGVWFTLMGCAHVANLTTIQPKVFGKGGKGYRRRYPYTVSKEDGAKNSMEAQAAVENSNLSVRANNRKWANDETSENLQVVEIKVGEISRRVTEAERQHDNDFIKRIENQIAEFPLNENDKFGKMGKTQLVADLKFAKDVAASKKGEKVAEPVVAYIIKNRNDTSPNKNIWMLWTHGNAEEPVDIDQQIDRGTAIRTAPESLNKLTHGSLKQAAMFSQQYGVNIYVPTFPGFLGRKEQGRSTEKRFVDEVDRGYEFLRNELQVEPADITMRGYSLGTGTCASWCAQKQKPIGGILLKAPITSRNEAARNAYQMHGAANCMSLWPGLNVFNTDENIRDYPANMMVMQLLLGDKDEFTRMPDAKRIVSNFEKTHPEEYHGMKRLANVAEDPGYHGTLFEDEWDQRPHMKGAINNFFQTVVSNSTALKTDNGTLFYPNTRCALWFDTSRHNACFFPCSQTPKLSTTVVLCLPLFNVSRVRTLRIYTVVTRCWHKKVAA